MPVQTGPVAHPLLYNGYRVLPMEGVNRPERGADHQQFLAPRLRMLSSYPLCACVSKALIPSECRIYNSVVVQYSLEGHIFLSHLRVFQYAPNTHSTEGWLDSKACVDFEKEKNLFPLARIEPLFFGIQLTA